jgi:uncharacterized protein YdcH (DUF465 family)
VAQDRNLLLRMDSVDDRIETWVRGEFEWTERHTNALLDVVLGERFRNALFQRIIEDNESRDEMLTRINNRQASLS